MHLVLQPRPLPHQRRPQPHPSTSSGQALLPPRLRLPIRLPRLRQQVAAQQMRPCLRVHPVVLQFRRGDCLHPLRMHQHQPLPLRFHHLAKRRPEAARLHRHPSAALRAGPAPLGREIAENTCAAPASRCSPFPPAKSSLLLLTPSCNKISGEDLRQRGSSRASFRACPSSTYPTLGGTPFLFSLHLSGVSVSRSEAAAPLRMTGGTDFFESYCPVSRKIGFCGGGSPVACVGPLKAASRSTTTVSAGVPFCGLLILSPVVFTTATAPASHMLT